MKEAIAFAVGLLIIWWLCEWKLRDRQTLTWSEYRARLKRLPKPRRKDIFSSLD